MRKAFITVALVLIHAPAMAQDTITAAAFLQTFEDRCAAVEADPAAAISKALISGTGGGAVTTDKAMLQLTELVELPGAPYATLFYQRYILPADSAAYCTITASFETPGTPIALPELADLITAAAPVALGAPVTRYGSDVLDNGQLARMFTWSTGDSVYDPSMTVLQTSTVVTLSAKRPAAN